MMHLVESIMSKPVITIEATSRVSQALDLMREKKIASLIIRPNGPDDAYGILTKRDIVTKVVARDLDPRNLFIAEIMTKPVIQISPRASLRECSILMSKANVRRLPVFDRDKLVGIISDTDIFQRVEESGWGPEMISAKGEDPFLANVHSSIRTILAQGTDAERITAAIMLAVSETWRAAKK